MEFLKDILIEILRREARRMGTPPHRRPCPYDLRGRPGTDTADRVQQKCPDFPCIEEILLILEILGRGGGSTTILDIHREIRVVDPFP